MRPKSYIQIAVAACVVLWSVIAVADDSYAFNRALISAGAAKIEVSKKGITVVTYEDLNSAGWSGLSENIENFKLYHGAEQIPIYIEQTGPDPAKFEAGEKIFFFADPLTDRYRNTDVYWLVSDSTAGLRINSISGTPSSGSDALFHMYKTDFERDYASMYIPSFKASDGEEADRFFWDYAADYPFIPWSHEFSYSFDLEGLVDAGIDPEGTIEVVARGGVESGSISPDHKLVVTLNDHELGYLTSDDKKEMKGTLSIPRGVLKETGNSVKFSVSLDTGLSYDIIYIDRFSITFPRDFTADSGRLTFTALNTGPVTVSNIDSSASLVWKVTDPAAPLNISGADSQSASKIRFNVTSGDTYAVFEKTAAFTPTTVSVPSEISELLRDDSSVDIDWLAICPAGWEDTLESLTSLRSSQGLATAVIAVEDIYNIYNNGNAGADGISNFLKEIKARSPSLKFVLLVGDATYDPMDLGGRGERNFLPTNFVWADYMETASDVAYAEDDDGSLMFHIGRVPARSEDELKIWVSKIIQSEIAIERDECLSSVGFVSDDADDPSEENEFYNFNVALRGLLDDDVYSSWHEVVPSDSDDPDSPSVSAVRDEIIDKWMLPNLFISYAGHGASGFWAREQIIRKKDVSSLIPASGWPVVLAWNCLNGYFINATDNTLAEEMLLASSRGAVGMVAFSGLGDIDAARVMAEGFFDQVFDSGVETLGEAFDSSRVEMKKSSGGETMSFISLLFGDPAMKLAVCSEAPKSQPLKDPAETVLPPWDTEEEPSVAANTGGCTASYEDELDFPLLWTLCVLVWWYIGNLIEKRGRKYETHL